MDDRALIAKLKELKMTKPRQEWVVLVRERILGRDYASQEQGSFHFWSVFWSKPLVTVGVSLAAVLAVFIISQSALPGDVLFPVKKIAEHGQSAFVSAPDKPQMNLEIANKRLQDLTEIAKTNQVKKLAPAISEFQANVAAAARDLARTYSTTSDPVAIKKIVDASRKLEEQRQKVEAMGVVVGDTKELDNAIAKLVNREITELEGRGLTEDQQKTLVDIKRDFEEGNYSAALEKILLMQP